MTTTTNNQFDNNGSMGKPPRLARDNFSFWKNRLKVFLIGVDSRLLDTIKEGLFISMVTITNVEATDTSSAVHEKNTPKARKFWSDDDVKQHALDGKERSILAMALPDDIYHSVINCQSAKEIWDTLIVLFEGTPEVQKNKRSLLI